MQELAIYRVLLVIQYVNPRRLNIKECLLHNSIRLKIVV